MKIAKDQNISIFFFFSPEVLHEEEREEEAAAAPEEPQNPEEPHNNPGEPQNNPGEQQVPQPMFVFNAQQHEAVLLVNAAGQLVGVQIVEKQRRENRNRGM